MCQYTTKSQFGNSTMPKVLTQDQTHECMRSPLAGDVSPRFTGRPW
ncbi:MAG: hypothetical protein RMY34_01770 [Aulosira sp. DedQUE10]|nr:hypothetical protein [Aulosira sp. DedQUE10]